VAVTISQVFCETRALYQIQPQQQQPQHQEQMTAVGESISDPNGGLVRVYQQLPSPNSVSVFSPRSFSWNPFELFNLESLVQPTVTLIGVVVGLFGFFQISNWLLDLVAVTKMLKKKTMEEAKPSKDEKEETNEIEARRKRMLSAEVS
jgi:hypothetical protein